MAERWQNSKRHERLTYVHKQEGEKVETCCICMSGILIFFIFVYCCSVSFYFHLCFFIFILVCF